MGAKLSPEIMEFVKFVSFVGLISFSAIIISFAFKAFKWVFKEKTSSMWWLFLVASMGPFFLILGLFAYFFEDRSQTKRIIAFKDGKPVVNLNEVQFTGITEIHPIEALNNYVKYKKTD